MSYELLKALHLVFTTLWFSGLFGIFWLLMLHREAMEKEPAVRDVLVSQYRSMRRGLAVGVLWPSAVLACATVVAVIVLHGVDQTASWLAAKGSINLLMLLLQIATVAHSTTLRRSAPTRSAFFYRSLGLLPLALLIGNSFLDIQHPQFTLLQGLGAGCAILGLTALVATSLRKRSR